MKRIPQFLAATLLMLLVLVSFSVASVSAADPVNPFEQACSAADLDAAGVPEACKETSEELAKCDGSKEDCIKSLNPFSGEGGILLRATKLIVFITGVASVIIIILSGIKYVVSAGDSNAINSAKNTLLYALVGLVVALLGQAIIVFVVKAIK